MMIDRVVAVAEELARVLQLLQGVRLQKHVHAKLQIAARPWHLAVDRFDGLYQIQRCAHGLPRLVREIGGHQRVGHRLVGGARRKRELVVLGGLRVVIGHAVIFPIPLVDKLLLRRPQLFILPVELRLRAGGLPLPGEHPHRQKQQHQDANVTVHGRSSRAHDSLYPRRRKPSWTYLQSRRPWHWEGISERSRSRSKPPPAPSQEVRSYALRRVDEW